MDTQQRILLEFVKSALWGISPILESKPDWSRILILANQQTLLGLVAEIVTRLPEQYQPNTAERLKLHSMVTKIYQSHALLNRKVAEIKNHMDSNHIHSVLLKGQGIALNYPNPLSRQCGDIDIYVGDKNYLKTKTLLKPEVEHDADKYTHPKHFNIKSEGVDIEIHKVAEILPRFTTDRRFQQWTIEQLNAPSIRKVEIGGVIVNLPPVNFDTLYIMNHAWHHFITGGIGLRQLCDWSIYLHKFHNKIDRKELEGNLRKFGLTRAWQMCASVAVKYLGLPSKECPLYTGRYDDKAEKILEVIWQEGNFGKYSEHCKSPRPKGHFAGKFHSLKINTLRVIKILSISPVDAINSWINYFIKGMRNVFVRVK